MKKKTQFEAGARITFTLDESTAAAMQALWQRFDETDVLAFMDEASKVRMLLVYGHKTLEAYVRRDSC